MESSSVTAPRSLAHRIAFRESAGVALLAFVLIYAYVSVPTFRTSQNLTQVAQEAGILGILACGQAMVILTGGIDLSVGAIAAVAACVAGSRMAAGTPWLVAVLMGCLSGGVIGWLNGALTTYRRLSPILVTLAMLLGARAAVTIITQSVPYNQLPVGFTAMGSGIRPMIFLLLLAAALALVQSRARWGRRLMAIGGSEQAAHLSGIQTHSVLRGAYFGCGLLAAAAGMLMASSANNAQANLADGYELEAIAAVVIGGIRLTGGEGSVIGAAIGAAIIVSLRNVLFLKGIPNEQYGMVTGAVILLAAFAELYRRRASERA